MFLLEIVWAYLRHDLDASAVALGARAAPADDLDAALTDALWFVSLAVESDAPKRARLADLARALVDTEGVVQKSTLMERCEGEFLEEAGFVASASAFRKKEIRVNTRVVYTQKKFNLLREESEGCQSPRGSRGVRGRHVRERAVREQKQSLSAPFAPWCNP